MHYGIELPLPIVALALFGPLLLMIIVVIVGSLCENKKCGKICEKYITLGYMTSAFICCIFNMIATFVLRETVVGALIVICIEVVSIYITIKKDSANSKIIQAKKTVSAISTFTPSSGILKLEERNSNFDVLLTIEKHRHYDIKYKPEEYKYIGVSGRGVSVGEVIQTGGYNYISNSEKTGKYCFNYCGDPVNKIELTDALLEKAKNSNISKYIKDNYIIVYDSDAVQIPDYVAKSLLTGSTDAMNLASSYTAMGYPTYSKCEEIKNWICGTN